MTTRRRFLEEIVTSAVALTLGASCKKEPKQVNYDRPATPPAPTGQTSAQSTDTSTQGTPTEDTGASTSPQPVQPQGELFTLTGIVAGAFALGDTVELTVARVNRNPQTGELTIDYSSKPVLLIVTNETYESLRGKQSNPYQQIQAPFKDYQDDKHGPNGCRRAFLMCDEYSIRATVIRTTYNGQPAVLALDAAMNKTGRKEDSKATELLGKGYTLVREQAKEWGVDETLRDAIRKGKDLYRQYAPEVERQVRDLFK